jgi:hypothetical protein
LFSDALYRLNFGRQDVSSAGFPTSTSLASAARFFTARVDLSMFPLTLSFYTHQIREYICGDWSNIQRFFSASLRARAITSSRLISKANVSLSRVAIVGVLSPCSIKATVWRETPALVDKEFKEIPRSSLSIFNKRAIWEHTASICLCRCTLKPYKELALTADATRVASDQFISCSIFSFIAFSALKSEKPYSFQIISIFCRKFERNASVDTYYM